MPFNEILVGGKTFTTLASRTLSLQELDAYPLIMLGNESMSRLFYRQFFLEHSADLKPDIEAATTDQMMTLVKSELGLAFVPEPMARSSLRHRSIVQLTLREAIPQRSVSVVYDRHRPLNTAARECARASRHILRYGMQKAAVFMSNQCIKCSGLKRRKNAVAKGGENVYTCTIQTSRHGIIPRCGHFAEQPKESLVWISRAGPIRRMCRSSRRS